MRYNVLVKVATIGAHELERSPKDRPMKTLLLIAILCAAGCYGWEYPKLNEIRSVENTLAVARLKIEEIEGEKGEQYLGKVIEIEGIIGHIANKGGRPSVSLHSDKEGLGMILSFGPDERQPLKALAAGDRAVFRGLLKKVPRFHYVGKLEPAVVPR